MKEFQRKFEHSPTVDRVSFYIDKLNPNLHMNLGDVIFFPKETKIKTDLELTSKDSVKVPISVEADYIIPIRVATTASDLMSKNYLFNLNILNEANLDLLIDKIIIEKKNEMAKNKNFDDTFFIVIPKVESSKNRITMLKADSFTTLSFSWIQNC